jgi:two-component system, chemotaxis family, response regulator WspF
MRIGIVNDMPLAVEALRRTLAAKAEHRVAWVAYDGAAAVELCASDTPDLVLMDLIMPGMDGVEATRLIMTHSPCAILVVTASVGANSSRVFDAMGHGALDAVDTPIMGGGDANRPAPLLAKIDTISKLVGKRDPLLLAKSSASHRTAPATFGQGRLLAIGASAGGPAALATLLAGLPEDLGASVVIIQHVDPQFAPGMAEWLDRQSPLRVRIAEEGEQLCGGTVLLAGTGDHLKLVSGERVSYTPEPRDYAYRPSIDVFFHSVTQVWQGKAVGVLLTGMGQDGAQGLKALRASGHHTIAQDQATSAVYGMPKAAAALKAAVDILPIDRIAERLNALFHRSENP